MNRECLFKKTKIENKPISPINMMKIKFNNSDIYTSDLHCAFSKGYSTLILIIIIIILIIINIHYIKHARIPVSENNPYSRMFYAVNIIIIAMKN